LRWRNTHFVYQHIPSNEKAKRSPSKNFGARASHAVAVTRVAGHPPEGPKARTGRAFGFISLTVAFYRYGFGLGFNSLWWPTCGPFWDWGFNCFGLPFYGYESYVLPQAYEYPVYQYSGEGRELPQLYLKDGTVYSVIDYWLVDGQIHFTMLDEGGTKSVEHVTGLDQLDLQKTIDVATQRGFRFMLRDEPVEQYLRDHPDPTPPVAPLPKNK